MASFTNTKHTFEFRALQWDVIHHTYHVGIIPKNVIDIVKIKCNDTSIQVDKQSCEDTKTGLTMDDVVRAMLQSNGQKEVRLKVVSNGRTLFKTKDAVSGYYIYLFAYFVCTKTQ